LVISRTKYSTFLPTQPYEGLPENFFQTGPIWTIYGLLQIRFPDLVVCMYCDYRRRDTYIYLLSRKAWKLWLEACTDRLPSRQSWLALVDNPFPLSEQRAKVRCDRIPFNLFLSTNQRLLCVQRELGTTLCEWRTQPQIPAIVVKLEQLGYFIPSRFHFPHLCPTLLGWLLIENPKIQPIYWPSPMDSRESYHATMLEPIFSDHGLPLPSTKFSGEFSKCLTILAGRPCSHVSGSERLFWVPNTSAV